MVLPSPGAQFPSADRVPLGVLRLPKYCGLSHQDPALHSQNQPFCSLRRIPRHTGTRCPTTSHSASRGVLVLHCQGSTHALRCLYLPLVESFVWAEISLPSIPSVVFALLRQNRSRRVCTDQGSRTMLTDWPYSNPRSQNRLYSTRP